MRHAFDDLPDGLYTVVFAESLEDPEYDVITRGGPGRLLSCFLARNSGIAELSAARVHDLLAQQLVIVVHLVKGPAFCHCHCALFLSVKALTEADEPRFRRPSKLTKVAVAG